MIFLLQLVQIYKKFKIWTSPDLKNKEFWTSPDLKNKEIWTSSKNDFLLQLVQIYKNLESGLVHISILDCPIKTSVPGPRLMSYNCYDMKQKEHTILSLIGSKKVT